MNPELLVMAAGMGSRFGGLKQLEPVGPHGETVMDYAVFDAHRAGVKRVVFVIRQDIEAAFRALPTPVIGYVRDDAFHLDLRCLEARDEARFSAQLAQLQF